MTSSSLTIITSQMKYLLGLKIPCREGVGSFILMWLDLFRYIQNTNICDLLTSLIALAIIVPVKELNDRCKDRMKALFPIQLLVVIVATVVSYYFNFQEQVGCLWGYPHWFQEAHSARYKAVLQLGS